MIRSLFTSAAFAALFAVTPALAQTTEEEDAVSTDEIVVTSARISGAAMSVRQGGQQDIKHFRAIAFDTGMPRPEALSVEGLMGEHDLTLPSSRQCDQLFCVTAEAMTAALPLRPDDRMFVGLGFASNLDAATWKREPVNLMAVVDKSGSMSGEPLSLVRASLRQVLDQMSDNDRFGIVLYGDMSHVYLAPTDVRGNRARIAAAIDAIQSAGSTNMEAGLRVGYDTAFADAPAFKGKTRMMLFTDEQPNTGRTDAQGFMGMAEDASRRGIGLTTIGVGVQFGDALAAKVSSVRGGNLFFIANRDDVKTTFEKQLDTMVSEIAHDVKMTMTPAAGYKITGVFGVPANILDNAPDGAVSITVPTAFLSTNGGGIFVSVGKDTASSYLPPARLAPDAPLMSVMLDYKQAKDGKAGSDRISVAQAAAAPSAPLRTAHALVDQFLAMREATTAFHVKGDPKAAHALLSGLDARMKGSGLADLKAEQELTGKMLAQAALMAGYGGELPTSLRHIRAVGKWEIIGLTNIVDLRRGDQLEFTSDGEILTYRAKTSLEEADDIEGFEINENQIHMQDSKLVFNYRLSGDKLLLDTADVGTPARISLRRIPVS